jgi:hypothetical protein
MPGDPETRAKIVVIVWKTDERPTEEQVRALADERDRWRKVVYWNVQSAKELWKKYRETETPQDTFATRSVPRHTAHKLGATRLE